MDFMNRINRSIRKNKSSADRDLDDDLFGDSFTALRNKGVYFISGTIGEDDNLNEICEDLILKHLTPEWKNDIQLIINSPGGYLHLGWPLIDLIDWIRIDVRTIGMGEICSLATMLVAAGTPGKRLVAPNTSIMVHNFAGGVSGKYTDIVANMKSIEDEHQRMLKFWKKHSKYTTDKAVEQNLLKATDLWLTPQEAIEHGIIDKIAGKN